MNCIKNIGSCVIVLFFAVVAVNCNSQTKEIKQSLCDDREAVVAGAFYPDNPSALKIQLESLFARAEPQKETEGGKNANCNVLAIIAPHAGYVYSGKVAASSYHQIDCDKEYENIFIIASSHRAQFQGASVYNKGDYVTPLGKVKVNRKLANKLIDENEVFVFEPKAHEAEHSLEVQLPFLQYKMKKDFQIVPIVTGTQTLGEVKDIAEVLASYFNEKNLFIVSSDFSHYPKYDDALIVDKKTSDAIVSNSVLRVIDAINENASANVENLVTSLCGWPAVLTLLNITEKMPELKVIHVDYQNSGDALSDKSRVVGYNAIVFKKQKVQNMSENHFIITDQEKQMLLQIARTTIHHYLKNDKVPKINKKELTGCLLEKSGAFVTLHKNGKLRGCIGRFVADEPLYAVVQKMAVAAATEDHRFLPVKEEEVDEIELEISVLTPLKRIDSIDKIEMGKHGIYIKRAYSTGTFLPQVARETGWTKEQFLGHCARDKAGIGWDGWKDAEIYTYEALVFNEKELLK